MTNRAQFAAALLAAGLLVGSAAAADEYDPQRAAHPVRIVAYALHPIGVVLDLLLVRPAHWLGGLPGIDKLVGHEMYRD